MANYCASGIDHQSQATHRGTSHGTEKAKISTERQIGKYVLFATVLGCCIYCVPTVHGQLPNADHEQSNLVRGTAGPEVNSNCDLFYIVVSTIDGKVSVLDVHKRGKLVWSLEADSRPLYSSSLANMEIMRNGKKMRIIPSLDGALYQFDGEKVEAVPMSAETLLSSTYRLGDDSMIVGSKELKNFGVDITTGEVIFHCGSDGCHHKDKAAEESIEGNSVLLITRNTQIVRSVDVKNGFEKWNFSVGQHEIRLPPAAKASELEDEEPENDSDRTDEDESIPVFTNFKECPFEEKYAADTDYEDFLRLAVPEGRVVALDKEDSSLVDWEHKFESPIAKAWLYRKGQLEVLSLFDGRHVPTLNTHTADDQENENMPQPLLYIGSHQKNLYIQPSPQMETVLRSFPAAAGRIGHVMDPNIKVAWRPYLNTASARTPILSGNRPDGRRIERSAPGNEDSLLTTSLTVWHEDYPFDTGYFLYPEFRDTRSSRKGGVMLIEDLHHRSKSTKAVEEEESLMTSLPASLWMYWKEVIMISLITSVAVHLILTKFFNISYQIGSYSINGPMNDISEKKSESQDSLPSDDSAPVLRSSSSDGSEYVSRFASDFECLHCLGRGGFGIVFEAINKVDDQHYAVKRIMLPKSDGAKEKVMREVKVLAKIDHPGIVRFFNAWVESPPPGWQEERDKHFLPSDLTGTNFSPTPSVSVTPQSVGHARKKKQRSGAVAKRLQASRFNRHKNLKPGVREEAGLDAECIEDSIEFCSPAPDPANLRSSGSSGEFSVHSNLSNSASGSYSGHHSPRENLVSFGFDSLPGSDWESSKSGSRSSVPFSNYSSTSSMAFSQQPMCTDNDMTGDSVVFESSSCNQSTGTESVIFADPSQRVVSDRSSQAASKADEHAIDITLSSHDDGGGGDADNNEDNEISHISNTSSKLFLYIQMQLYRKDTLKDWLGNNTLNRDRQSILKVFDEIVCAVNYLHKQGLMHRDLKPSNIFFSDDGHVKVGDFGLVTPLSVQHDQGVLGAGLSSDKHTAEVGTTLYMSPEQIANKPYDLKVDIFSMGLIFLELCIPFSTQMEKIRTLHAAKKQSLPERFTRELPTESDLVRRMTSDDPGRRPVTDEILVHHLFEDVASLRLDNHARKRTVSERSS